MLKRESRQGQTSSLLQWKLSKILSELRDTATPDIPPSYPLVTPPPDDRNKSRSGEFPPASYSCHVAQYKAAPALDGTLEPHF
jgi:hypothetical protein